MEAVREDPLGPLPPPVFAMFLCVHNGYAEVGAMIGTAHAYYDEPKFLESASGLARYVATVDDLPRTRLQHACSDTNHERGLARVQQFLNAPGVAIRDGEIVKTAKQKTPVLTQAQLINVGDLNELPLVLASACGNIPLVRLLCERGAIVTFKAIEGLITLDRDDIADELLQLHRVSNGGSDTVNDALLANFAEMADTYRAFYGTILQFDNTGDIGGLFTVNMHKLREFIRTRFPATILSLERNNRIESLEEAFYRHVESGNYEAADTFVARDKDIILFTIYMKATFIFGVHGPGRVPSAAPVINSRAWHWATYLRTQAPEFIAMLKKRGYNI